MRSIEVGGTATVYFNVLLADNVSPAPSESGGQPQASLNGGSFQDTGMTTLSHIGYGRYSCTLDSSVLGVTSGDVILTRYKSAISAETAGDSFVVDGVIPGPANVQYYGSISMGDLFFSHQLNHRAWSNAVRDRKVRALATATRLIDALSFIGNRTDENQPLQWPRNSSTTVPQAVENATYLCAYALLDGYDPEIEADKLAMTMNKYQSVQTFYVREFVQPWKMAGIPSSEAWRLLLPYLRDPNDLFLSRS